MSLLVDASMRLSPAVGGFRASGWRATCQFDGLATSDGVTRVGCEITIHGSDRIEPGQEAKVTLRFWDDIATRLDVQPGRRLRIEEG
jgi:hypothetical protein